MQEITVDALNENYSSEDGVLYNKSKTTLIKYPEGKNTSVFNVPNGVTAVEPLGFSHSKLSYVTLPASIATLIEPFYFCENLSTIAIQATTPPNVKDQYSDDIGYLFGYDNYYESVVLVVPKGAIDTYKAAEPWSKFQNITDGSNALAIDDLSAYKGKTVTLPILMNNTEEITGIQFDLYLPDGVTVAKDANSEPLVTVTNRMSDSGYSVGCSEADGVTTIIGISLKSTAFNGTSGAIFNVTLDVDENMTDGEYDIMLRGIVLSDVESTELVPSDVTATLTVKSYTLGDVDDNGRINVNDAVCIVNHILKKTVKTFIEAAADLDGNGKINVNDAVALINRYILKKSGARALSSITKKAATADDNYLNIPTINIKPGQTKTVSVEMYNTEADIAGIECNIKLPDGISFVKNNSEEVELTINDSRDTGLSTSQNILDDGSLQIVSLGIGKYYKGTSGEIFSFRITADEALVPGKYSLSLTDIALSTGDEIIVPDRTSILNVIPELNEDESLFTITSDITEADVTLNRTIVANQYNTLVLPFDLSASQIATAFGNDAKVYAYSNTTEDGINFNTTTTISANVPVLLKTSTAGSSYTFENVTLKAGTPSATGSYFDFVGNYAGDITLEEGIYFISGNTLYRSTGISHIKGYRAYILPSNGQARSLNLNIDGEATGIKAAEMESENQTGVYNLNGQRMLDKNGLSKGIYIVNGKKTIIK